MRIRTVTAMIHLRYSNMDSRIEEISSFLASAREAFREDGVEVQTVRMATQSFQSFLIGRDPDNLIDEIVEIEKKAVREGIDFISVGPSIDPLYTAIIPDVLQRTSVTCMSACVGDSSTGISWDNLKESAKAVLRISNLTDNGIKNFNFSALCNVPPGTPFFPASYHIGSRTIFSIGLESGGIVYRNLHGSRDVNAAVRSFSDDYWKECLKIQNRAVGLSEDHGIDFHGIDTSLCPSLDDNGSIAHAISSALGKPFSSQGTLAICSMLTTAVKNIEVKRCGYGGLMLPVLEDTGLAEGADRSEYTLSDLLSYSSVCGTGLDAVPVPGSVSEDDLSSVIMDTASLSIKLKKPLSCRILPIPGVEEGGRTDLRSPYLLDCRVIPVN
ncbi:MAG: DUF711 family protein [Thermoplasmatota archaeon]